MLCLRECQQTCPPVHPGDSALDPLAALTHAWTCNILTPSFCDESAPRPLQPLAAMSRNRDIVSPRNRVARAVTYQLLRHALVLIVRNARAYGIRVMRPDKGDVAVGPVAQLGMAVACRRGEGAGSEGECGEDESGEHGEGGESGTARGVKVVVEVVEVFVVVVLSEGGGPILFRRKRDVFPGDETASARRGRIGERIEKRAKWGPRAMYIPVYQPSERGYV